MTQEDDSVLTPEQLSTVRLHAERLLQEASAKGVFPTPIDDIMDAAKLIVIDDEEIDEGLLRNFLQKAKQGVATLKSALSKVLGLFEPHDRLVVIDKDIPEPRIPFVKLHEAGHGYLPHQAGMYRLVHDCEKTLDPYISDLFEREANVFASEMLFQGSGFANEAHDSEFSLKVPMALAKKYGASNYATFRRYVTTNPRCCCFISLEKPTYNVSGGFTADVRRVVASRSFSQQFPSGNLIGTVDDFHALGPIVPKHNKRMTYPREIILADRNGEDQRCKAEAFNSGHNILILIIHVGPANKIFTFS